MNMHSCFFPTIEVKSILSDSENGWHTIFYNTEFYKTIQLNNNLKKWLAKKAVN